MCNLEESKTNAKGVGRMNAKEFLNVSLGGNMTNIFEIIKPPFHYDDHWQMILDKDNNLVVEVRMWGLLSKYDNPEELQDGFGKMLAETLTNLAQQ